MCYPAVAYVAIAAAAAISAKAKYDQGQYAKGVSKYNARVDQNAATEVRNKGRIVENEERQKALDLRSRQRAVLASRGAQVDTGTALKIQEDTGLIGDINAMRVRQNTELQAGALETQAALTLSEGKAAYKQGVAGAASDIIGAIGSIAGAKGGKTVGKADLGAGLWDQGTTASSGSGAVASKWYSYGNKSNSFSLMGAR